MITQDCLLDATACGEYPATHEPLDDIPELPEGDTVTIGIGALCRHGATAIIASDLRATFPQSNIDVHDMTGKQWDFDAHFPVVACIAGKLGLCQPFMDELNNRLRKFHVGKPVYCEHVENAIRDARSHIFRRYADWSLRMNYGLTLREWQRGKVPGGEMNQFIHDAVVKYLDGLSFDVGIIVAGFLPDGNLLFYKASHKRYIEASTTPGVYVIGSGGGLAMDHLNKRQQCIDFGLPRTILHISEALDEARKVPDGSVGPPQAFTIVSNDGTTSKIDADAHLLQGWKKAYKDRTNTASLDNSEIAHQQINALLRKHLIPRSGARKSAAKQ